jgi:polyisoprenoid-binding protein YceI
MKTTALVALSVVALGLTAFISIQPTTNTTEPAAVVTTASVSGDIYKIDASKTTITWLGKKVTGEHTGAVKVAKGELIVDGGELKGGSVEVDIKSMTCTDITDKEMNGKLIGHLKSDDFFSADKFPTSSLKITSIKAGKTKGQYDITADLTIKGKTNAITFPATVKIKGNELTADATMTIDRTKYDIRYGSKSFFDNLGDKVIYDEFTLTIKLVAKK